MPLRTAGNANIANTDFITTAANGTNTGAYLVAGGQPCIGVQLVNRQRRDDGTYSPAHIRLFEHRGISSNRRHCEGAKQREQSRLNSRHCEE